MTLDLFTGSDKGADNVEFLTPSSALFSGYLLAEEVWINRELAGCCISLHLGEWLRYRGRCRC